MTPPRTKAHTLSLAPLTLFPRRQEIFETLAGVMGGLEGLQEGHYLLSHRKGDQHLVILKVCDLFAHVHTLCMLTYTHGAGGSGHPVMRSGPAKH